MGNIRKRVLSKAVARPTWEIKVSKFSNLFTKRREQFEFAISVHTTVRADKGKLKLDAAVQRSEELSQKCVGPVCIPSVVVLTACIRMKIMMQLFQEFIALQKELMADDIDGGAPPENQQATQGLTGGRFVFKRFELPESGTPSSSSPENDENAQQTTTTTSGDAVSEHSDNVKGTWTAVHDEPPQPQEVEMPPNAGTVEEGVTTFLEAVSPLITALDEVAKIHPFVNGASSFYHIGPMVTCPV